MVFARTRAHAMHIPPCPIGEVETTGRLRDDAIDTLSDAVVCIVGISGVGAERLHGQRGRCRLAAHVTLKWINSVYAKQRLDSPGLSLHVAVYSKLIGIRDVCDAV